METKELISLVEKAVKHEVSNLETWTLQDTCVAMVLILYSPEETGAPDYICVCNTYSDGMSAMNRYAETPCTSSIVIFRDENQSFDDFVVKLNESIPALLDF